MFYFMRNITSPGQDSQGNQTLRGAYLKCLSFRRSNSRYTESIRATNRTTARDDESTSGETLATENPHAGEVGEEEHETLYGPGMVGSTAAGHAEE